MEAGVEGGRESEIYFILTSYLYSLAILMVCCFKDRGPEIILIFSLTKKKNSLHKEKMPIFHCFQKRSHK